MLFLSLEFDLKKRLNIYLWKNTLRRDTRACQRFYPCLKWGIRKYSNILWRKVVYILRAIVCLNLLKYVGPIIWLWGAFKIQGYHWVQEGSFTESSVHLWYIQVQWVLLMQVLPWWIWIFCFNRFVAYLFLLWPFSQVKIYFIWSWVIYFFAWLWIFPIAIFIKLIHLYLLARHRFMFIWKLPLQFLFVLVFRGVFLDFCWVLTDTGIDLFYKFD